MIRLNRTADFHAGAASLGALLLFFAFSGSALAADPKDPVLLEGAGVQVTQQDVMAEAQRIPPEVRAEILKEPNDIAQLASNLYVRRALAAEAVKAGVEKDPLVQAQLRIARDKALSDLMLARVDASSKPSDSVLDSYAKTAYQADPKRFAAPEEVHARHILVKGSDAEARAKAEKLLAELKKGADFEALAKKESDDKGSGEQGGDLGFFGRDRMVKPFEEAAFALQKPGDLSPLVESPFGFHIIKMVERRSAGTLPFDEVSGPLRAEATQKAQAEARSDKAKTLLEAGKFNREAIEALSAQQQKAAPQIPTAQKPAK